MTDNVHPDSPEPGILVLTTRKPGYDNGNAIRITNVLEGLLGVGSVHLCLIDSTEDGQQLDPDPRLSTTVIRARERSRTMKVLDFFGRDPSAVPYRQMTALQDLLAERLGRDAMGSRVVRAGPGPRAHPAGDPRTTNRRSR